MSIVCVYKLCSRRTPAFHACNKHTDLIGGCFLFPRKSSKKAAPEIRGFQTVEKANAFSTKGMRLDCAQAFRAKREKLTLAQRAVCFRSAKPPDNMDFDFISHLRVRNSTRSFDTLIPAEAMLRREFLILSVRRAGSSASAPSRTPYRPKSTTGNSSLPAPPPSSYPVR